MDKSIPWIAVVDDEPMVRRAVMRVLRLAKMPAREFADGAQFLALFDAAGTDLPECVLLDIVMPEMSGLEVLARIRQRTAVLPVILMSGNINPTSQIPARQAGVVNFLAKPFHASTLVETIRTTMDQTWNIQSVVHRLNQKGKSHV
jgi:FixJ family two-component response regulator